MHQEQQPSIQSVGDRLLRKLGLDPDEWTRGDRRLVLLAFGIGLAIVVIALGGYTFGWGWTGLTNPKQRTFWDWLSLLLVPLVLALGGYLFTRSENRRTEKIAEQQRNLDRELADEQRQDDMLQAYLDGMSQLLSDIERPLHRAQPRDNLSTVARARTLTVLTRLYHPVRKRSVMQFLYESGLIYGDRLVLDLHGADLIEADLGGADLSGADLSGIDLLRANLREAILSGAVLYQADLVEAKLADANLVGANLLEANLGFAYLGGADLSGAFLSGTVLYRANLIAANLLEADLVGADLRGANLDLASLRGTNLDQADLSGALGVTNEEVAQQAASLKGATMPNDQKYEDWLTSKGCGKDGENSGPS